jgi:hypothetical protein
MEVQHSPSVVVGDVESELPDARSLSNTNYEFESKEHARIDWAIYGSIMTHLDLSG